MRTAQTLYSGIFAEGSKARLVRKLAAESRSFTKGTNISPSRTASVTAARPSSSPLLDSTRTSSPSPIPALLASLGWMDISRSGARAISPSTRRVMVPPCQWYSILPVLRIRGNLRLGISAAGAVCSTGTNLPRPLGKLSS